MLIPTPPPATAGTHSDSRADLPHHRVHQPADDAAASVGTMVCYLRTANAGTAGQRLLGRQRAKPEAEIAFHGWTVAAWIDNLGQPGTTLDRPGLTRALALLAQDRADALVAFELTLPARSAAVTRQLAGDAAVHGWQLVTVQDDRQLLLFEAAEPQGK